MTTVSLAMIVRNEEDTLHRCLSTVRDLVDDVVVVDTGSSDATVAVARQFGARIFEETWTDDFARARNIAFGHVGSDYIFWLDADDVLLEEDRQRFTVLREHLDAQATGYTMVYDYARDAAGASLLRFRLPRIVRRSAGFRWVGRVHEYLEGPGPLFPADVVVTHRRTRSSGDRNLAIYELMKRTGEPFTARDRLYYANELANHGRWDEAIPLYDASVDDSSLWVEDRLWAVNKLADVFQSRGDREAMYRVLYRGFEWDAPRPEACCRIGYDALQRGQHRTAAAWYDMAIRWAPQEIQGFRIEACYTWLPHLQLAVCLSSLGQVVRACWHNEQAARWVPHDENVLHNRLYFQSQGLDPVAIGKLVTEPD